MIPSGWSIHTPTRFIDGDRDRIIAQSGKLKYQVEINNLKKGLVPFISQYGQLCYGQYTKKEFVDRYNTLKELTITNLLDAQTLTDWADYKLFSTAFYMHMCRIALQQQWIWPALVSRIDNRLEHTSGNSRLFATGMCKRDPCNNYNVLLLESIERNPASVLQEYQTIVNDQQLHQILNVEYSEECYQPDLVNIGLTVTDSGNLILSYINNNTFHESVTPETQELWKNFVAWQAKYGIRPTIKIYTDWPELITNTQNAWNVEIAGSSKTMYQTIFHPGHLENRVRSLHDENAIDSGSHVMYIIKPRKIDLSELMCWTDLKHTTFIDNDWNFILYRQDQTYSSTFVSVSNFE
jgi:hypothetical protein